MIDFHTHILPGIDDGSRDMAETSAMLVEERRQGVDKVIATPHFYARDLSVGRFLEKRRVALDETREYLAAHPELPKVLAGAEVYYFPGMGHADQLAQLTVEGTRLLLLEMPFAQWTKEVLKDVQDLLRQQELKVLLVHLERFWQFQKDRRIWNEILSLPIAVQVNAGPLTGGFFQRRTAFRMLNLDLPCVLGSDCHNMAHRPPNLAQGAEAVRKRLGKDALDAMMATAEELLHHT